MSDALKLIAAPHTPMTTDGQVALDVVEQQAQWLIESGVTGVFINGTTGEGLSLTQQERRDLTQRWVDVAGGQIRIIVHVGHLSVPEACDLARHAQRIGADAISAVAPCFYKPADTEALVAYCGAIAACAPELPFYYYHSPGMTGCRVRPDEFLHLGGQRIATLAGVKFNDPCPIAYQRCIAVDPQRFDNPYGVDEALLTGLTYGATSAIGSTYNYAAPYYLKMARLFHAGRRDEANAMAQQVMDLIDILLEFGVIAAGKALMKLRGIDCGPPRLPLRPLSPKAYRQVLERGEKLAMLQDQSAPTLAVPQHAR